MPNKKNEKNKPKVHKDLKGFEISINEFGEIISSKSADELNEFLNDKLKDKKIDDPEGFDDNEFDEEEDDDLEPPFLESEEDQY